MPISDYCTIERFYSRKEVCKVLNCSSATLTKLLKSKKLKCYKKPGGDYTNFYAIYISQRQILEFLSKYDINDCMLKNDKEPADLYTCGRNVYIRKKPINKKVRYELIDLAAIFDANYSAVQKWVQDKRLKVYKIPGGGGGAGPYYYVTEDHIENMFKNEPYLRYLYSFDVYQCIFCERNLHDY